MHCITMEHKQLYKTMQSSKATQSRRGCITSGCLKKTCFSDFTQIGPWYHNGPIWVKSLEQVFFRQVLRPLLRHSRCQHDLKTVDRSIFCSKWLRNKLLQFLDRLDWPNCTKLIIIITTTTTTIIIFTIINNRQSHYPLQTSVITGWRAVRGRKIVVTITIIITIIIIIQS